MRESSSSSREFGSWIDRLIADECERDEEPGSTASQSFWSISIELISRFVVCRAGQRAKEGRQTRSALIGGINVVEA